MERPTADATADEWSVYGDHLQAIGDPRGLLIGLRDDPGAVAAHVREHATALLGVEVASSIDLIDLTWRHDRPIAVAIRATDAGTRAASVVRALAKTELGQAIEAVRIVGVTGPKSVIDVGPVMREVARLGAVHAVAIVDEHALASTSLITGRQGRAATRMRIDSLDTIWRVGGLRSLTLDIADTDDLRFGTIVAPELRSFALRSLHCGGPYEDLVIAAPLTAARWPALESFELRLVDQWMGGRPDDARAYEAPYADDPDREPLDADAEPFGWDELGPVFESFRTTRLRRLALTSAANAGSLLETLANAQIPSSVVELDLSDCAITDDILVRALSARLRALLGRMTRIVVRDTPLTERGLAILARLGPAIDHTPSAGARYRFVTGME